MENGCADARALHGLWGRPAGHRARTINNAGIRDQPGRTIDQDVTAFDRVLKVHVRGTSLSRRQAARSTLAQGNGANAHGAARAGNITGATLAADGGWLALGAPESVLG